MKPEPGNCCTLPEGKVVFPVPSPPRPLPNGAGEKRHAGGLFEKEQGRIGDNNRFLTQYEVNIPNPSSEEPLLFPRP